MYYFGSGTTAPAIARKIIETELIEEYHWLPDEIAKIPYKRLQEHFLIKKQRNANIQTKIQIAKTKTATSKLGGRSFVREI